MRISVSVTPGPVLTCAAPPPPGSFASSSSLALHAVTVNASAATTAQTALVPGPGFTSLLLGATWCAAGGVAEFTADTLEQIL